jgi:methanogenic corrinoid protein MtbC1
MTTTFAAALLRSSAEGFAGLAAGRLCETDPAAAASLPQGFDAWRAFLATETCELAAALDGATPERYAAHVVWARDAFLARGLAVEALATALSALARVLESELPGHAWLSAEPFLDAGRRALARPRVAGTSALAGDGLEESLGRAYLAAVRAGDDRAALAALDAALEDGRIDARGVLAGVLLSVMREVGRLWHTGELSVAEEHFASATTRRAIAHALARARPAPPVGRTVVVAAVAGDAHDLALAVVAGFFELAGWRTIALGADTPVEALCDVVQRFDAAVVALGATLETQREAAARAIAALRRVRPGQRVLVGGAAFAGAPELWRAIGADACAASAEEALTVADALSQA